MFREIVINADPNETRIAVLETADSDETVLEVSPGTLEFTARRIFDADRTRERVDLGGWIAVSKDAAPIFPERPCD